MTTQRWNIDAAHSGVHFTIRHMVISKVRGAFTRSEGTLESTRIERSGKESFRVVGDLTMRGITREVTLEAEYLGTGKDPWGNQRVAFQARGSLLRKDFGLTWNQALEAGGVLVGDQVELAIDLQATQAKAIDQAA